MTISRVTAVLEEGDQIIARGDITTPIRALGDDAIAVVAMLDLGLEPPTDPPVLVSPPTVAGYVVPGETLTATPAIFAGADTVTGQWLRAGVAIAGETGLTYAVVQADVMFDITYRSTATSAGGVTASESAPALDAVAAYVSDPTHIDIYGAIPGVLSTSDTGALGGIVASQLVQRAGGLVYGLAGPVLAQATSGQRPIYDVVGGVPSLVYDGTNDSLLHVGAGLASRLAVSWASEISVTYLRSGTAQPVWGTALAASATPYQRVANGAPSATPGASNVRTSIRDDSNAISTVVMTSTRSATGSPWSVRLSLRRTPTDQTITEVQPDSGTATAGVGAVALQDRFALGAFATPTGAGGYIQARIHAVALWSASTPTTLSVAASRALMTHWGMP